MTDRTLEHRHNFTQESAAYCTWSPLSLRCLPLRRGLAANRREA